MDIRIKKEPVDPVKENDGTKKIYYGSVTTLESSYGFIIRDGDQRSIFFLVLQSDRYNWSKLQVGQRVCFELAFNYRGPCALNVRLEQSPI